MDSALMDPNTTPVMMPPEGVVPNFENPISNAYITRDVGLVFFVLMIVFLALRLCSRVLVTRSYGVDDLLDAPNGRHLWDVPISVLTNSYLQINFTFVLMSAISIMLVKLSLLFMYLRMFKPVQLVKIFIYVSIGAVTSFYVATIIAELAVGIPRPGEGWPAAQMRYGNFGLEVSVVRGVFGVISDFVIFFIPLSQVIRLHLPLKRKITLVCIFLTGLLFRERGDPDFTWANTMPNTFSVVEITVGHICGSVPALPALITSLKKNRTLLSLLQHLRSSREKEYNSDATASASSTEKMNMPPSKLKSLLTGLRAFLQKVHLIKSPKKERSLRIYRISEYDDLEYAEEVDYHAHVRDGAAANATTYEC
ncbi:hypothetical protein KVR01_012086 [Diaporthe batatas]|uniref:uncharacterized protein n=1 Tax=Diaporthe batatas TaxID=748121 RepID=UPI001D04960F|nr:uncharacterized protein KVR01_012086 [Diaporthe batatas]KAG8158325.1 hypothetical protein KVR01_012086 [Diaporthe batatas]